MNGHESNENDRKNQIVFQYRGLIIRYTDCILVIFFGSI